MGGGGVGRGRGAPLSDELRQQLRDIQLGGVHELYAMGLLESPPPEKGSTEVTPYYMGGEEVNLVAGLKLHEEVLSPPEQDQVVALMRRLQELGEAGALIGQTYSAPPPRKGMERRVTVQFGCCFRYDRQPPSIAPKDRVCGLPQMLDDVLDRMVHRRIFSYDAAVRPNSCIANYYPKGTCIPPHVDSRDFARPFASLSLVSEQEILFGVSIKENKGKPNQFVADKGKGGGKRLKLPPGSVLLVGGRAANKVEHCIPV